MWSPRSSCSAFDRNFHEQHIAVQPLPFWSLDESYPMINGRGYPDTINPNPLPAPSCRTSHAGRRPRRSARW